MCIVYESKFNHYVNYINVFNNNSINIFNIIGKDTYPLMEPYVSVDLGLSISIISIGQVNIFLKNKGDSPVKNIEWEIKVRGAFQNNQCYRE